VHSGSLNEEDNQRGIAHFLEHLAFAGSTNFPPGTVRPFFENLGLSFGRHQNAVTGFDRTGYTISLPNNEPDTIDAGLLFLSDVADNLLLPESGIEQERAIILEERRASLSPQQRVLYDLIERIAPGSEFGQRIPIGTEEVLTTVGLEPIKAYYDTWYVPSNMTLLIVGDVTAEDVTPRITEFFGGGELVPAPEPRDVGVRPTEGRRAIVASDPEESREEVGISFIDRPGEPTTTLGGYRRDLVRSLATSMMNDRLSEGVRDGELSMLGGSVSSGDFAGAIRWTQATGRSEKGRWQEVLSELGREVRRATLHGFTKEELEDARTRLLSSAERAMLRESTRPSRSLQSAVVDAIASREPYMSVSQQLDLLRELLPSITLEEVNEAFAELFGFENAVFTLQTPEDEQTPSEDELLAAGIEALDARPEPYTPDARAEKLLDEQPTPGDVAERSTHEETGVTSLWLSNGVRLHVKRMTERQGTVLGAIQVYGGLVNETPDTRGLSDAASTALTRPAGGGLSSSQISDLTTGWKISVGGGANDDGFQVALSGSPDELPSALELAHLLLTDPTVEDAAIEQWRRGQISTRERLKSLPQGAAIEAIFEAMYPEDDSRPKLIPLDRVEAITPQAAQVWLDAQLAGPIEVTLVGDLNVEETIELVRTYLGSLPDRPRVSFDTNMDVRTMARPVGPREVVKEPDIDTPQAFVIAGFFGANEFDERDRRALQLSARILSRRMIDRIREELGLAYSPGVSSSTESTWPGFGLFSVQAPTDPARAEQLADEVHSMFADFAENGPSEEELAIAVEQLRNIHDESIREPNSWLRELRTLAYLGRSLDTLANEREALGAFTAAELRDIFAKYAVEDGRIRIIVRPKDPAVDEDLAEDGDVESGG
jgi:zinc protease